MHDIDCNPHAYLNSFLPHKFEYICIHANFDISCTSWYSFNLSFVYLDTLANMLLNQPSFHACHNALLHFE
eukprot:c45248_g1_i1 orf=3-215(+)